MNPLDLSQVTTYVNENIDSFHRKRLAKIQSVRLRDILRRKNPYLFRAKNITTPAELISSILDATLSSSEEGLFGNFPEELAIFVNQMTCGGQKSSSPGIDLDFTRDNIRYMVAVKSGPNWGNSSQYQALRDNFRKAAKVLRQSQHTLDVRAVLGMCYGRGPTVDNGEYLRVEGQAFWEFISGDPHLYIDLLIPLGYEAQAHFDAYLLEKNRTIERLAQEFAKDFCDAAGQIDWPKLLEFNSGNR
jgi:hypothetical protein